MADITFLAILPFTAIFSVLAKQALDMRKDRNFRAQWGWVFWSILPVSVYALAFSYFREVPLIIRNLALGILGGAMGASGMIWLGYVVQGSPAEAQTAPQPAGASSMSKESPPSISVQNSPGSIIAPSGGNNTVNNNFGPQRRSLESPAGQEFKKQLLATAPKTQPYIIHFPMNNPEAFAFVRQLHEFLQSHGYHLKESGLIEESPGPQIQGIGFQQKSDGFHIYIGPG